MKLLSIFSSLAASILFTAMQVHAEVKLPKIFSDHMVLQRDMPIHVWGEATPDEKVTVSLEKSSASVIADKSGRWNLYLAPQPAGGPFTLTVRASNILHFDDVLLGDLWIASGQSNMELPLKGYDAATQIQHGTEEIAAANYPQMRLLLVQHDASDFPLNDVKTSGWAVCNPDSAKNFSAVAYFFGRAILHQEHVPIGLIDASWGGSPAEAWTSLNTLGSDAALMPVFANRAFRMDRQGAQRRLGTDSDSASQDTGALREWHSAQLPGTQRRSIMP